MEPVRSAILKTMTSRTSALALAASASAFALTLLVSSCSEPVDQDPAQQQAGGGPAGGGMAGAQARAPEPAGSQHSHDEMRSALETVIEDATITDTDDWWSSLRDINRELQKLQVAPTDCKAFVTASALPVPTGALAAIAENGSRRTAVHSFEDAEAAQLYVQNEADGVERCEEHTIIRELEENQVEAETTIEELEIRSGAEDALAVRRLTESEDGLQRDVAVVLRHSSTVVGTAESVEDPMDKDEAEELAVELEAEAARVLSELVGEEIVAPEPEPDDDEDDEDDDGSEEDSEADS